jgi:hypothetical protein
LVVQVPDSCEETSALLARSGFLPDVLADVISATMIDVTDGFEAVMKRMNSTTRHCLRQAERKDVRIREGGRDDLGTFHELMLATCIRQGVKPNPPHLTDLQALWDAAAPVGCMRLFLAEHHGESLAGAICIPFGQTVSYWKKGWSGKDGDRYPNDLIMREVLRWVAQGGYKNCDFCAIDREIALAMLSGSPLSTEQKRSRHMFHVRFGGRPSLLPAAQILFPNPLLRLGYRVAFHKKLRRLTRQVVVPRVGAGPAMEVP